MSDTFPATSPHGLPEHGQPADAVLDALETMRSADLDWKSGKVWAYVYPLPAEADALAKQAYMSFLTENGLDPTAFPSVMAMENALVDIAVRHLGMPEDAHPAGNFTSGGTESIMLAVKAARDRFRATHPSAGRTNLVVPVTAHAAFHKAAWYLDVEVRSTPVDPTTHRADVPAMAAACDDHTILLVGSSPSYAHGVIDDIGAIGRLGLERDILVHVDACVGGWLLPFFRELGADIPPFDFSVPGVTSMSMDLHKYACCPKGASLVLYRDKNVRKHQIYACSNWSGYTVINPTVQSTRTAGPVAAAWALLHHLGRSGYRDIARKLLAATRDVVRGIEAIDGLQVMGTPVFTLVAASSDTVDVFVVCDEMRARGWYVQPQLGLEDSPRNLHLSVHPGTVDQVDAMLADLADSVEAARTAATGDLVARLGPMLATLDPAAMTAESLRDLLGAAGIQGASLPDRLADINGVLDTLAPAAADVLLTAWFNDLNAPPRG